MWDVFLDDMGLDNDVELEFTNLDLNDLVLEPIIFYGGDPLEVSSSTPTDAQIGLYKEEEPKDGWVRSGSDVDFDDDYMEDYW